MDAGHGGATHDSHIWNNHPIKLHLEELTRNQSVWLLGMYSFYFCININYNIFYANYKQFYANIFNRFILTGDSGYPLRKYLMTPITNATSGTQEAHYTTVHVRTRCTVERTIGLLKARFRCLLVHRVLHYTPQVAGSIVNACVILHNMCVRANMPEQVLTEEEAMQEDLLQNDDNARVHEQSTSNRELNDGLAMRRTLVSRLWASRNP